jgi:hypothetical protein
MMANTFKFKSTEDLFFYVNDNLAMRFIGDGNSPYTHLPLTFWMYEKQLTGNNCFKDYVPICNKSTIEYALNNYSDEFFWLNKYIMPEIITLPVKKEEEFNNIMKREGLSYLADMHLNGSEITLENKLGIVRGRIYTEKPLEIYRFNTDDICSINRAFMKCMRDTAQISMNMASSLYEGIILKTNEALNESLNNKKH